MQKEKLSITTLTGTYMKFAGSCTKNVDLLESHQEKS